MREQSKQVAIRDLSIVILIVASPPGARLVAAPRGAVEPLVHAPEPVQAARECGISVVDNAVLERKGAHARPLARVRGSVYPAHLRVDTGSPLAEGRLAPVVVLDAPLVLLLLGEPDAEVRIEV